MEQKRSHTEHMLAKAAANKTEVIIFFASGRSICTPVIKFDTKSILGMYKATQTKAAFERKNINFITEATTRDDNYGNKA